jgi:dolichyl-phosphate-mannose--protein O-mannosyl transferase
MLYYLNDTGKACGANECVSATMLIGTPVLWWASPVVGGWAVWRTLTRFDWRYAAVLVGYGAGYLPWFLDIDRQMYFFYATPMAPFLVLGITLALGDLLGRASVGAERRATGLLVLALYLGAAVANFAWLWPIMVGSSITTGHWDAEMWLPSWR